MRRRTPAVIFALALSLALAGVTALAQPAAVVAPLAFDVASVKPHVSDDQRVMMVVQPGGRFVAQNVPLRFVIRTAYQLQDDQIVGGPAWLSTDRFDIQARAADSSATPVEQMQMLRTLLSQRFALTTHFESRELPVFALLVARKDGTLGPRMTQTACPPTDVDLAQVTPCARIANGRGQLSLRGASISAFVQFLSPVVSRAVIDRSGLMDRYDIELAWTPERAGAAITDADHDAPSIFTAIQEQLGLRLDATRAPMETLVIDRVDHPSPD